MGIFTRSLGVDPGSAFIRVCRNGEKDVFSEPSLAAVDFETGKVVALGKEAEKMLSDTPEGIAPVRPVRGGALAEYGVACEILKKCISCASCKAKIKYAITVPVSGDATDVEIRALRSALSVSGAKSVHLIETPIAAALGAGIDVNSTDGRMIIDVGAGRVEIAVVCMGEIVCGKTLRIAGNDFDNDIKIFVKKHYGINIGEKTAEDVKISIGSVCEEKDIEKYTVSGRESGTGLPGCAEINSAEVGGALCRNVKNIIEAIRFVLEKTPLELVTDISRNGIVLTGGGAKLRGLCELISCETGIMATLAENSETAVVRGCAIAFSEK